MLWKIFEKVLAFPRKKIENGGEIFGYKRLNKKRKKKSFTAENTRDSFMKSLIKLKSNHISQSTIFITGQRVIYMKKNI